MHDTPSPHVWPLSDEDTTILIAETTAQARAGLHAGVPSEGDSALCAHLDAIALAMRANHIAVRPHYYVQLQAHCRINVVEMQRRFGDTFRVLYVERDGTNEPLLLPKTALLSCVACQSRMEVVHPEQAQWHTPWFPPLTPSIQETQ